MPILKSHRLPLLLVLGALLRRVAFDFRAWCLTFALTPFLTADPLNAAGHREPPLLNLELAAAAGQVTFVYRGRSLAVYEFKPAPQRPCLSRLTSLEGLDVLYAATPESPHTRGLALGFRVNGATFSEVGTNAGWQRSGPEISRRVFRDAADRAVAEMRHTVYWLPSKSSPARAESAVLVEERCLRFAVDAAGGEVSMDWNSTFEAGPDFEVVYLDSEAGEGLSLRLALEFSQPPPRSPGMSPPSPDAGTPVSWITRGATFGERGLYLTLFAPPGDTSPSRPRFHFDEAPYGRLSEAPDFIDSPHPLRRGEKFEFHTLVTIHSRSVTPEYLTSRGQQWIRSRSPSELPGDQSRSR